MKYLNIFSLALFIVLAGFVSADAQTVGVSGTLAEPAFSRGSTARGTIVLNIENGLHVNSSKPNSEYAIPTTVRISGVGVKQGAVEYPEGSNRKFQFSESELNVYEGEIIIPFSVVVPRGFRGSTLSVKAVVRYQACTEEVCYPPKNKEIVMTAVVK
jgi:hypothetical protein